MALSVPLRGSRHESPVAQFLVVRHNYAPMKIVLLSCLTLILVESHAAADDTNHDWELVGSVPNPFGVTNDYVVIPKEKIRDLTNYQAAAAAIAGTRDRCSIFFWTDHAHIPTSADIAVTNLQVMAATYERHPNYTTPHFRLACWLYPNVEAASHANAFFMPGFKMPKSEVTTNKALDAINKP